MTLGRYGLPLQVVFCRRCCISNQRPSSVVEYRNSPESPKRAIAFDAEGVCDACRVAEQKANTDWAERERELRDLLDQHRSSDGSYDVIVPGSGGKDSFFAAHVLKHRYGMHPLTVTWAPHLYTAVGWENFQRWIHAGFDNLLETPNGRTHRLLTRLAVDRLFHAFQAFVIGQKAFPPKMAVMHKIPLVIYGEHEADYGNARDESATPRRSAEYYARGDDEIYLGGASLKELREDFGLTTADLEPYMPARPEDLERVGVNVSYLGYYLKWRPQDCYYYAVEHGGFKPCPERTAGTYSKYVSLDDKADDWHYFQTFVKFGIGRATYDAAQEIRSGEISRDEGVALVRRYDGEYPVRFEKELLDYVSVDGFPRMTRESFMELCDSFRPEHLWRREGGEWKLRHAVWHEELAEAA